MITPITADQLRSMLDRNEDLILINTLPPESFEKMKIPGARNIPGERDDFIEQVTQAAGGKEKTVVVYCASAQCDSSSQAAQRLEAAGFENVFDFEGGYEAWEQQQQNAPSHASASAK